MPTTPNGLPYPASSAAPNVPADIQTLATTIDAATYGGVWADYTPTLGFTNTTVTSAKWRRVAGKLVVVEFLLTLTGTPGAAGFTMSLPVTAGFGTANRISLGTALIRDSSTGDGSIRSGTIFLGTTTTVGINVDSAADLTTSRVITQAIPWTWATGDTLGGQFQYREA